MAAGSVRSTQVMPSVEVAPAVEFLETATNVLLPKDNPVQLFDNGMVDAVQVIPSVEVAAWVEAAPG